MPRQLTQTHRLALARDDDDLLIQLDAVLVAQHARQQNLRAVAHGIDGAVLDHEALVRREQRLERAHDATQVRLVLVVLVHVLRVEHVVHRGHVVLQLVGE